ncbi:MAG: hypothetical protein AAF745_03775, partial [Planctomycetota bacterium]
PLGVLLWHEATLQWVTSWGVSWDTFVGTGADDGLIQILQRGVGWTLFFAAIAAIAIRFSGRATRCTSTVGISIGAICLSVITLALYVRAMQQLPMLIEHGGQVLMPICLLLAVHYGARSSITVTITVVAVMLTFAGHGAYAAGMWPTPANFYAMTTVILGTDFETTQRMLFIAGVLDFAVCVGLLVPYFRGIAAGYAVVWGFLTAMARPVAGMSLELNYFAADQHLHQAILRAPHFILPAFLVLIWSTDESDVPSSRLGTTPS